MTTTVPPPPIDQPIRDRLRTELDSTFFVEAGAGTGKTRELVGRIVALVSSLTFGGIALGSWLWGHFAESYGVAAALAGSGGAMIVLPLIGLLLPMPGHEAEQAGSR